LFDACRYIRDTLTIAKLEPKIFAPIAKLKLTESHVLGMMTWVKALSNNVLLTCNIGPLEFAYLEPTWDNCEEWEKHTQIFGIQIVRSFPAHGGEYWFFAASMAVDLQGRHAAESRCRCAFDSTTIDRILDRSTLLLSRDPKDSSIVLWIHIDIVELHCFDGTTIMSCMRLCI
jgi:hypothetical protein